MSNNKIEKTSRIILSNTNKEKPQSKIPSHPLIKKKYNDQNNKDKYGIRTI